MKKIISIALLVSVVSLLLGYWAGMRHVKPVPQSEAKKPLYYRNPMGLPDTSPVPKKDAMGMDYVAVYEESPTGVGTDKVQKLGVKSEAVKYRTLDMTLRATGRIEIDERHVHAIAPKFEGWIDRLYVNSTGEKVSRGQALFDVYSPELISAQREYELARAGEAALTDTDAKEGMKQLADAALARLKNWGMGKKSTYTSEVFGIVQEKKAVQGMRFMPGETLFQIADLSSVWVMADVAEQDIARIRTGSVAKISVSAYPEKSFEGKIAFIYPALNAATRTVQVRVECANPAGLLMPSMFATLILPAGNQGAVLSVPASSVIDSGTRQIVLVQSAAGRFEPRTVKLGLRGEDYVEVLSGVSEGEQVATSALFLLDAESNLKAALSAMDQPAAKAASGSHQGQGVFNRLNEDGSVSIAHEPIKSLNWPGMTMDFALANSSLAKGIKPATQVSFEIVERAPDEWVITRIQSSKGH